jgi:hypothetical protein
MISKGDLVRVRLTVGGEAVVGNAGADASGAKLRELVIVGKVVNYTEDEETYIIEPKIISVPKEQVTEIVTLPKDFDFGDVSMEMQMSSKKHEREKPSEIANVRFSRGT